MILPPRLLKTPRQAELNMPIGNPQPQTPDLVAAFSMLTSIASLRKREQRTDLINAVKSFADLPGPIRVDDLRQIIHFENKLHPIIQSDKRWFFSLASKTEALQFARDMFVLHGAAAHTLEQLLARCSEWSYTNNDELLQQFVALALYHHGAAIKWSFFRYEPVKPAVWPALHQLFSFAEKNGFSHAPVNLFDHEARYTISAQSLYIRALLLEVLNTGSLSLEQVEIADGWLAEWTADYLFDTTYLPHIHSLFVDTAAAGGLQLVTGNTASSSYRYLRMNNLKNQLETVRAELRAGRPYHGRGTPNLFAMDQHIALLSTIERLYETLLNASASRIEERTPVNHLWADIRLDFAAARNAVAAENGAPAQVADTVTPMKFGDLVLTLAPAGETANLDAAPTRDRNSTGTSDSDVTITADPVADNRHMRWKIHDISSKGVGLLVDRATGEYVSAGQLLAVKPDGMAHWLLGVIVRKLTQRTVGETLLGIEILCYRPLPILLARDTYAQDTDADVETKADLATDPIAALYLPGTHADGKSDILILPTADFQLKNIFSLATQHSQFRVRINRVLRKGNDWVGLRFEVIGKDGA